MTGPARESLFVARLVFILFVHVANAVFEDQQIGFCFPVDLDAVSIIPLDDAAELLTIIQHHHHGSLVLHLLQIVEAFRIGLLLRGGFALLRSNRHLVLEVGKGRTNEAAVHVVFLRLSVLKISSVHKLDGRGCPQKGNFRCAGLDGFSSSKSVRLVLRNPSLEVSSTGGSFDRRVLGNNPEENGSAEVLTSRSHSWLT